MYDNDDFKRCKTCHERLVAGCCNNPSCSADEVLHPAIERRVTLLEHRNKVLAKIRELEEEVECVTKKLSENV